MTSQELHDPGLVTLLDLDGEIFPMDNGFWTKFDAKVVMQWDHIHSGARVKPYDFQSAGQLLEDFWNDVERIIENS